MIQCVAWGNETCKDASLTPRWWCPAASPASACPTTWSRPDSARSVDAPAPIGRISEHDPDWRIADVKVDEVHKGTHPKDTVSIRFPSSEDVMWHDAPKFHPGQEGFFILHKTDDAVGKKAAIARGAAVQDKGEFVAPNAADFQPFSAPGGVRQLIESPGDDVVPPARRRRARFPGARAERSPPLHSAKGSDETRFRGSAKTTLLNLPLPILATTRTTTTMPTKRTATPSPARKPSRRPARQPDEQVSGRRSGACGILPRQHDPEVAERRDQPG